MSQIPSAKGFDSTLRLLQDPYLFISKECRRQDTEIFETRLLFEPAVCFTGPAAAEVFYDTDLFSREGAMPAAIQKTLLGRGGVQGLDGDEHRRRKEMLMSLMTRPRIDDLLTVTEAAWEVSIRHWAKRDGVVLYDALHVLLSSAVCAWAGVHVPPEELAHRSADLALLFDGAGAKNLRHLASRRARKRCDRWAKGLIEDVRAGRIDPTPGTALHTVANHRTRGGKYLDAQFAGVDLLNVLRPTVAISVFIVFVAHALESHPHAAEALRAAEPGEAYAEWFVQEVRRLYPFFPVAAAVVKRDFEWHGYQLPAGRRVLLDLYGTDVDARTWENPMAFRPERFEDWDGSPFNFIPQGGGDYFENHRCAGEWITIALMKQAARMFAWRMTYAVPPQNLSIDYGRLPALPHSRFVMAEVRPRA